MLNFDEVDNSDEGDSKSSPHMKKVESTYPKLPSGLL